MAGKCKVSLQFFMQDIRKDIASINTAMMMTDLVMNPEKYPDKLAASRKACAAMAREYGMTRQDLPQNLQSHFEEFLRQGQQDNEKELHLAMIVAALLCWCIIWYVLVFGLM